MARPLGERQEFMLRALRERGSWYGGCGYKWNNYSDTVAIFESLVRRGLALRIEHHAHLDGARFRPAWTEYRPA